MDMYQNDTIPMETSESVRIIGSFSVPAVSYSRDTLVYRGPVEQLFFDVTGWDSENNVPIGEFPKLIPDVSAFYVQVIGSNDKVIKVFVAKVNRVYGYQISNGNQVYLKFGYTEVSPSNADVTVVEPAIAHIYKDKQSDFIALLLEGDEQTCVQYADAKLQSFKHGDTVYQRVIMQRMATRTGRNLDGVEVYQTIGVVLVGHPEFPSPDHTDFINRVQSYFRTIYSMEALQ